jgi:DNA-binding PadR family transcriptional regulator
MDAIAAKTDGQAKILPGTLYVTLNRMVDDGLILEVERPEGADTRRRYYAMTELGQAVMTAESERMARLVSVARREAAAVGSSRQGG